MCAWGGVHSILGNGQAIHFRTGISKYAAIVWDHWFGVIAIYTATSIDVGNLTIVYSLMDSTLCISSMSVALQFYTDSMDACQFEETQNGGKRWANANIARIKCKKCFFSFRLLFPRRLSCPFGFYCCLLLVHNTIPNLHPSITKSVVDSSQLAKSF